jgi:hypothetical protein
MKVVGVNVRDPVVSFMEESISEQVTEGERRNEQQEVRKVVVLKKQGNACGGKGLR